MVRFLCRHPFLVVSRDYVISGFCQAERPDLCDSMRGLSEIWEQYQAQLLTKGRVFPMACQTDASIERTLAHGDALRLTLPFAFAVICRAACSILLSTSFFLTLVLMKTRPLDIPNSIGYIIYDWQSGEYHGTLYIRNNWG